MAYCGKCGRYVSRHVFKCPHCGGISRRGSRNRIISLLKYVGWILFLISMLALIKWFAPEIQFLALQIRPIKFMIVFKLSLCGWIALLFPIPEPAVKPAHRSTKYFNVLFATLPFCHFATLRWLGQWRIVNIELLYIIYIIIFNKLFAQSLGCLLWRCGKMALWQPKYAEPDRRR